MGAGCGIAGDNDAAVGVALRSGVTADQSAHIRPPIDRACSVRGGDFAGVGVGQDAGVLAAGDRGVVDPQRSHHRILAEGIEQPVVRLSGPVDQQVADNLAVAPQSSVVSAANRRPARAAVPVGPAGVIGVHIPVPVRVKIQVGL